MKRKKLLIISHTQHYNDANGNMVGWGPTVREINYLAKGFDHIYHVACLHQGVNAPPSSATYTEPNITFIPLPPSGGKGMHNKLKIVAAIPVVLYTVFRYLKKADVFQLRLPTGMGVYVLPFITLFVRKPGWFKYAGNWNQQSPPLSYRFQRFWLAKCQRRKVTINGKWPGQPEHCISFENPCLTTEDRKHGEEAFKAKNYSAPLIACFAGRLEDAKGVYWILEALRDNRHSISEMHLIGDGSDRNRYESIANGLNINIFFHGFLAREDVFKLFAKAHIFILPSLSEGFPKAVAEAANYGCVPVVSNVSAIPQYVTPETGFVWNPEKSTFREFFNTIRFDAGQLKRMAQNGYQMAGEFSYMKYQNRVKKLVDND